MRDTFWNADIRATKYYNDLNNDSKEMDNCHIPHVNAGHNHNVRTLDEEKPPAHTTESSNITQSPALI
jgi:hypothetical protein